MCHGGEVVKTTDAHVELYGCLRFRSGSSFCVWLTRSGKSVQHEGSRKGHYSAAVDVG